MVILATISFGLFASIDAHRPSGSSFLNQKKAAHQPDASTSTNLKQLTYPTIFNWDGGDIDQLKNDWIKNQGDAAGCSSVDEDECGVKKRCQWDKNELDKYECLYICDSGSAILVETKNLNKYFHDMKKLRGVIGPMLSDGRPKNVERGGSLYQFQSVCAAPLLNQGGVTAECTKGHYTVVGNCISNEMLTDLVKMGEWGGPAFEDRGLCSNAVDPITQESFTKTHLIKHVFSYAYEDDKKNLFIRCFDIQSFAKMVALRDSRMETYVENGEVIVKYEVLEDILTRIEIPEKVTERAIKLIEYLKAAGAVFNGTDVEEIRRQARFEEEEGERADHDLALRFSAEGSRTAEELESNAAREEAAAIALQQENMRIREQMRQNTPRQ